MAKDACIKAYHEMEERYSRLVLNYYSNEQRKKICDSVAYIIEKSGIAPSLSVTPNRELGGEYSIEFHDDYDKKSGEFFEELIKKLDISQCEIG